MILTHLSIVVFLINFIEQVNNFSLSASNQVAI